MIPSVISNNSVPITFACTCTTILIPTPSVFLSVSVVGTPTPEADNSERAIILGSVVFGSLVLALLLGIGSVCLFIFLWMHPKLKKENGEDDITIIAERKMMQDVKHYDPPDFELEPEKKFTPTDV